MLLTEFMVTSFFPTPPIRLKLRLPVGRRLLVASHLEQSETGINQQIRFECVYWTFKELLQGLCKLMLFSRVPEVFQWIHWTELSSKISSAGSHNERWWRCSLRLVLSQVIPDWYVLIYQQYTYQYHIPRLLLIYQYNTGKLYPHRLPALEQ
jgi:hypothetical protein